MPAREGSAGGYSFPTAIDRTCAKPGEMRAAGASARASAIAIGNAGSSFGGLTDSGHDGQMQMRSMGPTTDSRMNRDAFLRALIGATC